MAKPVSSLLLFCRHNLLGALLKDSTAIHLHDIQYTVVGNDEVEPSVLERSVYPGTANNITSFSWHPTHESRLLTISLSGTITDYVAFERITLNWSPSSHIVWTHGRRTLKIISNKDTVYNCLNDISVKMRRRAVNDYGLKVSNTCLKCTSTYMTMLEYAYESSSSSPSLNILTFVWLFSIQVFPYISVFPEFVPLSSLLCSCLLITSFITCSHRFSYTFRTLFGILSLFILNPLTSAYRF